MCLTIVWLFDCGVYEVVLFAFKFAAVSKGEERVYKGKCESRSVNMASCFGFLLVGFFFHFECVSESSLLCKEIFLNSSKIATNFSHYIETEPCSDPDVWNWDAFT